MMIMSVFAFAAAAVFAADVVVVVADVVLILKQK